MHTVGKSTVIKRLIVTFSEVKSVEQQEKKENRRATYSKRVIKESFIELLDQKPLSKISVKEICEMADVNRCTFYSYFEDIYDLHEKIMQEFYEKQRLIAKSTREKLKQIMKCGRKITVDDVYGLMMEMLSLITENIEISKIIYNPNSENKIHLELGQMYFDMLVPIGFPTHSQPRVKWLKNAYTFVTGGFTGAVYLWIIRDFPETKEAMAMNLSHHIYNVLIDPRISFEE